jgi:hypothetical protein
MSFSHGRVKPGREGVRRKGRGGKAQQHIESISMSIKILRD